MHTPLRPLHFFLNKYSQITRVYYNGKFLGSFYLFTFFGIILNRHTLYFKKVTPCLPYPFLPFHSIPIFHFFQLFKSFKLFHSIPFFFNHFFQLFKSLYNIFKSQPFILPQNQQSQTILTSFLQTIFKPF